VVALAGLAACGGGGKGTGDGSADCVGDATITLSGAFVGTRTAPSPFASWTLGDTVGTVWDQAQSQYGTPFVSTWTFTFLGPPAVGTYTEATAGLSCMLRVTDATDATNAWQAENGVMGAADQGSCSLTLSTVAQTSIVENQTIYCVHGSVYAMLPGDPGGASSGTVLLTSAF
jgi:hypothetical protein